MTTRIDTALRRLDAADPDAGPTSTRAQSDLTGILHAGRSGLGDLDRLPTRRHRMRRSLVAIAAVAAAFTAVFVAAPSVIGGDRAFASWTATPTSLGASESAEAAKDCQSAMLDGAGVDYASELAAAEPAVAEQRGDWTMVVLTGADGFAATCITDDSRRLFGDMFGSIGMSTAAVAPEAREIAVTDLGSGAARAGDLSVAAGVTGSDVAAITYESATRATVTATVSGGRFALWFPGDELESASTNGIELNVTYANGETSVVRAELGAGFVAPPG